MQLSDIAVRRWTRSAITDRGPRGDAAHDFGRNAERRSRGDGVRLSSHRPRNRRAGLAQHNPLNRLNAARSSVVERAVSLPSGGHSADVLCAIGVPRFGEPRANSAASVPDAPGAAHHSGARRRGCPFRAYSRLLSSQPCRCGSISRARSSEGSSSTSWRSCMSRCPACSSAIRTRVSSPPSSGPFHSSLNATSLWPFSRY